MASHGESMLSRPGGLVFPSAHVFITRSMPAIGLENPEGDMLHIYNTHASAPNKSCVIFDFFLRLLGCSLGLYSCLSLLWSFALGRRSIILNAGRGLLDDAQEWARSSFESSALAAP